jgi:hypothetical protein
MASPRPEHRRLRHAVHRARAGCEADLVARMTLAAHRGSWRAAAWQLERQYPERGPPASRRAPALPAAPGDSLDALDELAPRRGQLRLPGAR